ncbi:LysR family transcriptional regulator [Thalassotalea profundi]|uniref:LysR family transcriptional regulator n=1 Tax=Thalassotalea profundi TaxID=2036687 RepID=A0ABQ3J039_9GAMM|nr:LysR family transcriptional regulator [Thalassotalea profundi]GHE98193.1 LysR family transcriptional regulator [Thalassotalea profundi]
MINHLWLKTFCTLAEIGHFTKTADKLFMTQSGVSQHIKKLEQQLGITLLIRDGKSFTLNDAGNKLFIKGQELLKSSQELERLITQDEPHEGSIIMASPGSVGLQLYPHLLNIQIKYPKLVINYDFAPNRSIEQRLANREIDLGIISQLSGLGSIVCEKIAIEPLVLVTSQKFHSIDWQTLLSLGFISHPDANHHGQLLLSKNFPEFEHVNQFIQRGYSNQISLILEPVSKGLGFTVLPLFAAKAFHQQNLINIHPLINSVSESLYLCVNKHAIPTNRVKFMKNVIKDFLC